ncbi:MAG: hypothetical protein Q8K96_10675 [Rubrivivax sp.]|nr:hypothetical protein [Rubrivivax sp.]
MSQNLIPRSVALCLAALFTLAVLGGIDQLAQPGEQPAQMAQPAQPAPQTSPRA